MKHIAGNLNAGEIAHFWVNNEEGGAVASFQDVGAALEANKAAYNHNDGYTKDRSMRRVANIPAIIAQKWMIEEGLDIHNPAHAHRLMHKLNDPDWQYLRTAKGNLGKAGDGFR